MDFVLSLPKHGFDPGQGIKIMANCMEWPKQKSQTLRKKSRFCRERVFRKVPRESKTLVF